MAPERSIMTTDPANLEDRYRHEPDEVLLAALETGSEGYNADAWRVISAEATRRGLVPRNPEAEPSPESAPVADDATPDPLPQWLSATLLTLAALFLVVQVLLLLAYYGLIDQGHAYLGSPASLALGLTAYTATKFVRVGPHADIARMLRFTAIALTAVALIIRY
jgi:hypothetical protein